MKLEEFGLLHAQEAMSKVVTELCDALSLRRTTHFVEASYAQRLVEKGRSAASYSIKFLI
ncbi:MAG: hypothetical protein HWQ38_18650 [Nostoc sp. NMS7]|uniref:hypothetical protein n=1 Tax=uncultured Nostoc sp. TaxID=340711 RepID=UPI0035CBA91B|nr:hypothetical protein [Nostoc sp. NMS7]